MRIRKAETYTRGHLSVVRVESDCGTEGIGQIAPSNADISAMVFHRQVAPLPSGLLRVDWLTRIPLDDDLQRVARRDVGFGAPLGVHDGGG